MGRLAGKIALVTGGSRGIGRGIAERLAAEGASVAIGYRSAEESARETLAAVEQNGGRGTIVAGNVADAHEAASMVTETVNRLGGLHILVNNAGISADMLTMRMSEEDWDRVVDTGLKGAFLVIKFALRPLMRQRWGRIINIASVVAHTGNVGQANYAAAKAGLVGLTKSVAREVATRGITANVVAPGLVQTEMTDALPDEVRQWMLDQVPMGKPGNGEDVAAAVAFLAGDDAGYITGQVLNVDGGMVMV